MKYLLILLCFSLYSQECRYVVGEYESLKFETLDLNCRDMWIDSYSVIEVDSLKGCGRVLYGRYFENDTIQSDTTFIKIIVNRFREYRTPLESNKRPILVVNKYLSDSIIISGLVR